MGKTIKCPKCGTEKEEGKQYCQKCLFNVSWWARTGTEHHESKANLPFTKGL